MKINGAKMNLQCFSCDDDVLNPDSSYAGADGEIYCERCFHDTFSYCSDCGDLFWNEDIYYHNNEPYCEDCLPQDNKIKNYDYKPSPEFRKQKRDDKLYFGIELEVEFVDSGFDIEATSLFNNPYFYLKHDASLDDGFEIVSHPATYRWLLKHKSIWNKVLTELNEAGLESNHYNCGMHIHLSRNVFSPKSLLSFLLFFQENKEFIRAISGRPDSFSYCSFHSDIDIMTNYFYMQSNAADVIESNFDTDSRFRTVNLQNDDTIEVRIFRGTLVPSRFWRNVEFCRSLYNVCSKTQNLVSLTNYLDYVEKKKRFFPNLSNWIVNKLCRTTS